MTYEGNCRLGELFTSRREKGRAGLPTLSVTLNDGLVNREDLDRKQDTTLTPEEHLLVKPGDIAYNMMRMWQGAFGLAECEGLVSPAYVVLKPKPIVDSQYVTYLFKTNRVRYLFWAFSYGLTDDRLRLYPSDFSKIPVFIPSLETQRKHASALSVWDDAINLVKSLISLTEIQRLALAQKLVAGKAKIPGYSRPWEKWKVRDMGQVVSGGTPDTDHSEYWGGEIPWATPTDVGNLSGRYISRTERSLTNAGLKASAANKLPKGALLVCTRATICELAIAQNEIATNQGFKSIVPNGDMSVEFLYWLFKINKKMFVRLSCGSTFLELSKRDFERMEFHLPEREEQDAIVKCINSFDDQVQRLTQYQEILEREVSALTKNITSLRTRG